jgi:3'(2'), 5'-bisphosphate nucleotidase
MRWKRRFDRNRTGEPSTGKVPGKVCGRRGFTRQLTLLGSPVVFGVMNNTEGMRMPYAQELQAALEAVAIAGKAILALYDQFKAIPDAAASISTEADHQSQELILGHLHARFPDDAMCAEEETPTLASLPHVGARLWIIDPIDGTRGFAKKNGEFSVMVGFVHEDNIGVGVVFEPVTRRLTYAVRGGGCWRRDADSDPVRCRVTGTSTLAASTMTQSHSKPGQPSWPVQALKPARVVETYSAGLKLAIVARGEADLYVNTYTAFHDWDICAGHVLVEEAGGTVTGLAGQTLRYGLPEAWQRQGLLASNGVLHESAVKGLKDRAH